MSGGVAIAGASGFVGRALCQALAQHMPVVALSRSGGVNGAPLPATPCPIHWRSADLFHLRRVEEALRGIDTAIYLVHSMLPAARLLQGHFADLDLICADNFARAAALQGVRRIVYLSGLIPDTRPLSPHLQSRLEVEWALAGHGAQVTVLRAGLILGPEGSSAQMMVRLVSRLPALVLPRWCQSRCQPAALSDVLRTLCHVVRAHNMRPQVVDLGCPEPLSYADMLRATAAHLSLRRPMLEVPAFTPNLSLWWVAGVTSTPLELVRPLVMSLQHDMLVRPGHDVTRVGLAPFVPFAQALKEALAPEQQAAPRPVAGPSPSGAKARPRRKTNDVVSVQRLPLPAGKDAAWVARAYARWLPRGFFWLRPLVGVVPGQSREGALRLDFVLRGLGWTLLRLVAAPNRSNAYRQLFYIEGGLLARPTEAAYPGRFEFRCVLPKGELGADAPQPLGPRPDYRFVLAAIHDFVPRLPWLLYKLTQAVLHALVMQGFGRHLAAQKEAAQNAVPRP